MMPSENEQRLDRLFRAYRDATPVVDAAPDFMPLVWRRIESRRGAVFTQRVARVFATVSLGLAVLAGLAVSLSPSRPLEDTFVEAIANHSLEQNASYYEPVRLDLAVERAAPAPAR